jgi:DNA repair exonuclease SbcCD ATPase subunit
MRRSSLNAFIKQIQSELGAKEHILHLASNQKSVIKNIEDQITELETDKEALTHLINSLSPTDGLIAQGLLGFIRSYVDEMNEFIEKVWAYSMTIQACDVQDSESLDLDYKFPINIDDPDDPVPDVSKCSKGMKEIINLAFKITAMKNLDLLDTPLYLDEFGSAMDTGHKNEIISLIKSFNEQKTFSQMFIVSHDVTQYSSISNAQVCVVCETNIITPESFNEHVKIH